MKPRHMKSVSVGLLVFCILGLSVLSFLAMNHDSDGASGCLALAMRGADCLKLMNPLELASLHLAVLKGFSTALIQLAGAFAVFLAFVLVWRRRLISFYFSGQPPLQIARKAFEENLNLPERKIIRWLALHELSPALG